LCITFEESIVFLKGLGLNLGDLCESKGRGWKSFLSKAQNKEKEDSSKGRHGKQQSIIGALRSRKP
jgi:hypothetical protein